MKTTTTAALACAFATFACASPKADTTQFRAGSSPTATGAALPAITTKGNAFFAGNDRFYIKGVDYQPGGSSDLTDPLADYSTCSRDIAEFKKMGLNTIRVYSVNNAANHDQCMQALADAGIYLALDVNTPNYSINRGSAQQAAISYNADYLQNVFATIDAFAGYDNTMLFFSGNEVLSSNLSTTKAAPYVKATTRDMMQYIAERGYRQIPVGYAAADVSQNQYLMAQYMDCGPNPTRSNFYAINNYEWCDPSSYQQSGWAALVELYGNYSQPLFMSEYGCITNGRTFAETTALYQSDMTSVFSGGLVYEYSNNGAGYGLVDIKGNTIVPIGNQVTDFESALAQVNNLGSGGYTTSNTQEQPCPAQGPNWDTSPWTGSALPAMPSGAEKYLKNGAGQGAGFAGPGSQNSGTGDVATASAGAGSPTATYGHGASNTGAGSSKSSSAAAGPGAVVPSDFRSIMVCGLAVVLSFGMGALAL